MEPITLELVREESWSVLQMAIPLSIGFVIQNGNTLLALSFAGNTLATDAIASVVMGFMIFNVCCNSIVMGLCDGYSSIISQAIGAGSYTGPLVQKMVVMTTVIVLPVVLLVYAFIVPLMSALGQPGEAIPLLQIFLLSRIPAVPAIVFREVICTWMQANTRAWLPLFISLFVIVTQAVLYYFSAHEGMSAVNIGVISTVGDLAHGLLYVGALKLLNLMKDEGCTLNPRDWFQGWWALLPIGCGAGVSCWAEWWAGELLMVVAGSLGTVCTAAQGILINWYGILSYVVWGAVVGGSVRIGQIIGEGQPRRAEVCACVVVVLCVLSSTLFGSLLFLWGSSVVEVLVKDTEVRAMLHNTLPLFILYVCIEWTQTALSGTIMKSICKMHHTAFFGVVTNYFIGIPIGIVCSNYWGMGLRGLWYGMLVTSFSMLVVNIFCCLRVDWAKECELAVERLTRIAPYQDYIEEEAETSGPPYTELFNCRSNASVAALIESVKHTQKTETREESTWILA